MEVLFGGLYYIGIPPIWGNYHMHKNLDESLRAPGLSNFGSSRLSAVHVLSKQPNTMLTSLLS